MHDYNRKESTYYDKIYVRIHFDKAIDIHSSGIYSSNVLSNFWGNGFTYDGVQCKSMEGFVQVLKYPNKQKQNQVCQSKGTTAKHKFTER